MKSKTSFHRPRTIPVWAGWLAIVCVISIEFGMLMRFGCDCFEAIARQDSNESGAEVQFAFR
jgi:hypothetical protein